MLSQDVVDSLFPPDLPEPEHLEQRYPPRDLPEEAKVTRFSPSPTGFLHIGGVYAATIDVDVARQSGGVYFVRLEDTDQARVAEGAAAQFAEAFAYFSIGPDEDDETGHYGPYSQSERSQIYLTYVRELLRQDRAYPCFATKQDLEEITARQRAAGALPGYYGKWAIWRDADPEEVAKRLAAGEPYVVRFRSPGTAGARVSFTDAIRGELSLDDNRNNAVILKSSDTEPRLPTYHFAHAVDDHLMRVNLVIRGEEWISSVPLHLQLFDALGFPRVQYAHIALLMKQEGGSRRKLSKRRDPEATVSFYIERGYPAPAVQYYLRGLANGRLAEMPLPEALAAPIRLSEMRHRGPAGGHGQAGRHLRRLHRHPARPADPRRGQHLGQPLCSRPGRGPGRRAGAGAAGAGHRAGGRRQPAQGPAQVGGFPRRLRVLLPGDLRAGHRPRGRPFRRPRPGPGAGRGPGLRRQLPAAGAGNRLVRPDPPARCRPRVRA